MRHLRHKFINDPIDSHGPANKLQLRIRRVRKDEVIRVELRQLLPAHAARQSWDMIH